MNATETTRRRILLSAYACEPGKGSEPGRGWFTALEMARHHDIWVVTRQNNRACIEAALELQGNPNGLHFVYLDLPSWIKALKRGGITTEFYYYAWQLALIPLARKLDEKYDFDLVHHVTFNRYSSPSGLAFLKRPFIWGQVGGGETTPKSFRKTLGRIGRVEDAVRNAIKWISEKDPWARYTARRSCIAVAGTAETARRLRSMGAKNVEILPGSGLSETDLALLAALPPPPTAPLRFISIGRLLAWKGYHLSLEAFANAAIPDTEYWIVGDGPEKQKLENLAKSLRCADRVRFLGKVPRNEALDLLGQSSVLLHPSLHDSAGWAYLEAMAAGRPVICMKIGGGEVQVSDESGIRIFPTTPEQAVKEITDAMSQLQQSPESIQQMGKAGKREVAQKFTWSFKAAQLAAMYEKALMIACRGEI